LAENKSSWKRVAFEDLKFRGLTSAHGKNFTVKDMMKSVEIIKRFTRRSKARKGLLSAYEAPATAPPSDVSSKPDKPKL